MTRDELVELLTVERFTPAPAPVDVRVGPGPTRAFGTVSALARSDDDVSTARRRRELVEDGDTYSPRAEERARYRAARRRRSA